MVDPQGKLRKRKLSTITILILVLCLPSYRRISGESFGFQEFQRNPGKKRESKDFSTLHPAEDGYEPMFLIPMKQILPSGTRDEDFVLAQNRGGSRGPGAGTREDWETELERELKEIEEKERTLEQSRGISSPTQFDPRTGDRSTQNLMMDITAAVDMLGSWDNNKPQTTSNSFDIREAEFGFFGAIDQWGRGTLLVAAHNENGKYMFEIHEANIIFPFLSKYVNLKLGKMFLDWGRLNRIHRHDWPFTTAPLVHSKLMDQEAVEDTGGEISFLLPFFENLTQELVIGVTNGRYWGHTHDAGQNKNNPMVYAHLKNFYYFGNNWGAQFGGTAIRFEPDPFSDAERRQYGLDAVLRWNQGNLKSFMVMSELWYRENRFDSVRNPETFLEDKIPMDTQWGYYIFVEYQLHQLWFLGYRYDFFNVPNLRDSRGNFARNAVEANTLQVTFRPSEFSYIRGSVERRYTGDFSKNDNTEFVDYRYYVQVTYILGSHPAHQY
jgi:hypothetical protein